MRHPEAIPNVGHRLYTMAMLPDEILFGLLNSRLPGREVQIRTVATLFNV